MPMTAQEALRRLTREGWQIVRQTGYLERSEIMEASLRDFGCAIVCDSLEQCVALANEIAPEHLELCVDEPFAYLDKIKNAGSIFLGKMCPEALERAFPELYAHVEPLITEARAQAAKEEIERQKKARAEKKAKPGKTENTKSEAEAEEQDEVQDDSL